MLHSVVSAGVVKLDGNASPMPELTHDPFSNDEVHQVQTPGAEAVQIVNTSGSDAERLRKVAETFATRAGRNTAMMIATA